MRSILVAVALMALAPLPALAQGRALPVYADATIREWAPEFRDMVNDNYRRMILNQLSPAEAQRLRAVKWEFPADPAQVLFDFYARGDGTIVLPVASLLLLKDLANAEAWLTLNGYSSQTVLDYLSVIRRDRLGQWPARATPPRARSIPRSSRAHRARSPSSTASMPPERWPPRTARTSSACRGRSVSRSCAGCGSPPGAIRPISRPGCVIPAGTCPMPRRWPSSIAGRA